MFKNVFIIEEKPLLCLTVSNFANQIVRICSYQTDQ